MAERRSVRRVSSGVYLIDVGPRSYRIRREQPEQWIVAEIVFGGFNVWREFSTKRAAINALRQWKGL